LTFDPLNLCLLSRIVLIFRKRKLRLRKVKKKKEEEKKSQAQYHMPGVLATWEAEAGGS
jgi:hypothetical protein